MRNVHEMSEYTIGEAAEILGVTPRTLRHWESKGLLVPGWRTTSDYRLYTEDDLQTGFAIVVYKSAGLPLADIASLLEESSAKSRIDRLKRQREVLSAQLDTVHTMITHLDEIIAQQREQEITMEEIKKVFGDDMPGYQEEAEQRWGHTKEWAQSQEVQKGMTLEDWQRVKAEQDDFVAALASASDNGVKPGSAEAEELVARHRAQIGQWYDVSTAKQVLIARTYVADPRWEETYKGHAPYLLELIEEHARREGLDLEHIEWG